MNGGSRFWVPRPHFAAENGDNSLMEEKLRGDSMLRHVRYDLSFYADALPFMNTGCESKSFSVRAGNVGDVALLSIIWYSSSKHVKVCGSFDDYIVHSLIPTASQHLGLVLEVAPGRSYFRFLVDGKWRVAKDCSTSTDLDPVKRVRSHFIDVKKDQKTFQIEAPLEQKFRWYERVALSLIRGPTDFNPASPLSKGDSPEKRRRILDLIIRGRRMYKEENYNGAIGTYSEALRLAPVNPEVYYEIARAFMRLGHFSLAEIQLRTSITLYEDNGYEIGKSYKLGDALQYYGVLMDRTEKRMAAEQYYKKAIKVYRREGHEGANVQLVRDNLRRNLKWQMENDENSKPLNNTTEFSDRELSSQDIRNAANAARKSLVLLTTQYCMNQRDEDRYKHDSNIEIVNEIMKEWHRDAINLKAVQNLEEAVDLLTLATFARKRYGAWITPFTIEFQVEIGNMLIKLDRYEDAELHLQEATQVWLKRERAKTRLPVGEKWREETYGDVLRLLGTVYDKTGRRDQAEKSYRSAIKIYRNWNREVKIVDTNRLLVINLCAQGKSVENYEKFLR